MTPEERIKQALEIAASFGGIDGAHHKQWTIDQIVRALTDCPMVEWVPDGVTRVFGLNSVQGESEEYQAWVRAVCEGEDGPDTYEWDVGIAP